MEASSEAAKDLEKNYFFPRFFKKLRLGFLFQGRFLVEDPS